MFKSCNVLVCFVMLSGACEVEPSLKFNILFKILGIEFVKV
jgi:hypothetical protein